MKKLLKKLVRIIAKRIVVRIFIFKYVFRRSRSKETLRVFYLVRRMCLHCFEVLGSPVDYWPCATLCRLTFHRMCLLIFR